MLCVIGVPSFVFFFFEPVSKLYFYCFCTDNSTTQFELTSTMNFLQFTLWSLLYTCVIVFIFAAISHKCPSFLQSNLYVFDVCIKDILVLVHMCSFGGKFEQCTRARVVCGGKMEACVLMAFPRWSERSKLLLVCILLCLLVMYGSSEARSSQLSPDKSLVFGPGVHPERAGFPVNYFYIQAVDTKGKK